MKKFVNTKIMLGVALTLGMNVALTGCGSDAIASDVVSMDDGDLSTEIEAISVTGWNQRLGDPVMPLNFVGEIMIHIGGVCGESGPQPIDQATLLDATLCTYSDPAAYSAIFGIEVTEDTPNQNIPYADYPHLVSHSGEVGALPQVTEVPWFTESNGAQNRDYTVDEWLSASGEFTFNCTEEGNSYHLSAENLVPGGLYTLSGFVVDIVNPPPPEGTGGLQPDLAFGGTSANVFTADIDGKIDTSRFLNFCPMTWPADEQFQLIAVFLAYHMDGRVNAAVGHTVGVAPFIGPGVITTPQLMFPIPAEF